MSGTGKGQDEDLNWGDRRGDTANIRWIRKPVRSVMMYDAPRSQQIVKTQVLRYLSSLRRQIRQTKSREVFPLKDSEKRDERDDSKRVDPSSRVCPLHQALSARHPFPSPSSFPAYFLESKESCVGGNFDGPSPSHRFVLKIKMVLSFASHRICILYGPIFPARAKWENPTCQCTALVCYLQICCEYISDSRKMLTLFDEFCRSNMNAGQPRNLYSNIYGSRRRRGSDRDEIASIMNGLSRSLNHSAGG